MGPNRMSDNPYGDERRNYGDDRRGYSSRSDHEGPSRRDSRDSRDYGERRYSGDNRDIRSPLESRYGHPKDVRLPSDASFNPPAGPRKPAAANKSPTSASDGLTDELHIRRLSSTKAITTSIVGSSTPPSTIPKAKDPNLQEAFKALYNCGEKSNERLLLLMRKNKLAREDHQWRYESGKFASKAAAYPPYHGLADKFLPTEQHLDQQIKVVEDDYARELEQFIARLVASSKPVAPNDRDSGNADLQAKVDQMSQLVSKQTEQIQTLLTEGTKTRETLASLESALKTMESDHNLVKKEHNALKSEHEALKAKFQTSLNSIQILQSRQQTMVNDNKSLTDQLQNFRSSTELKLGSSEARLTELAQRSSNASQVKNGVTTYLEQRIAGIENKLAAFPDYDDIKEKLDDLDLATFNEMCEAWVSEDYNLKTQYEEYSQRRRQGLPSTDNVPSLSSQAIENIVNTKVAAAKESINDEIRSYCEQRDDIHGDLIDGALAQIQALKEITSSFSSLPTRIRLLEERKTIGLAPLEQKQNLDLAARISSLESKTVDARVDRIDLEVTELNRKTDALISEIAQYVRREWVELRVQELFNGIGVTTAFVAEVRELQREMQQKIPSLEHGFRTLDSQIQSLSTKQLAEHIVRITMPHVEQRLTTLEFKTNHLESKANESDRTINNHVKRLFETNELLNNITASGKRFASPIYSDEANKRRKLDVNGGGMHSPVQKAQPAQQALVQQQAQQQQQGYQQAQPQTQPQVQQQAYQQAQPQTQPQVQPQQQQAQQQVQHQGRQQVQQQAQHQAHQPVQQPVQQTQQVQQQLSTQQPQWQPSNQSPQNSSNQNQSNSS